MKRNIETWELIKAILATISKGIVATELVSMGSNQYKYVICNTKWAVGGYNVTIGSATYQIVDVVANEYIIVKGTVVPTDLTFDLYDFHPRHGTILATNSELDAIQKSKDKYPMVYLHEITREKFNNDPLELVGRESECDIFFLGENNISNWTTDDHYSKVIRPLRNLLFEFVEALDNYGGVNIIDSYEVFDHARFGEYLASKGHVQSIFNANLSGTQLRITIPFNKSFECECE